MVFFFILFVVLCFYRIEVGQNASDFRTDYMSVEKTAAIKGIFVLIVFFSHFQNYVSFDYSGDILFFQNFNRIGQRMVTPFLFFSGYGVMESIKRKGLGYVHRFPLKRILRVLVEFDAAVIIFTLAKLMCGMLFSNGKKFDLIQVLLSLVGWSSVGNSNWYIFTILILYIITFISFEICRAKLYPSAVCVTVFTVLYIFLFKYYNVREPYWYNTAICYVFGMWHSLLKPYIDKLLFKNSVWFPVTAVFAALCRHSFDFRNPSKNIFLYDVCMFLFVYSVILLSMKVSFNNKALVWLGKNLFPMYIFQRLPMMVFQSLGLNKFIHLYFVVCFACTVLIALGFSKLSGLVWNHKKTKTKVKVEG